MKKNMILLMVVLLALCWYSTVGSWLNNESKYQKTLENVKTFEEQELYLDAIDECKIAMQYKEDHADLMLRIAEDYRKMGDERSYLSQLKSTVSEFGPMEESVGKIYEYYAEKKHEGDAIEYIADLRKKYPDNSVVEQFFNRAKTNYYELYRSFAQVSDYVGKFAVYEYEGKKGIIDAAGEVVLKAAYDEVGIPLKKTDGFPVKVAGRVYVVSEKGYKIAQPQGDYQELGIISDRRVLAKKNGKYGYLDNKYKEITEFLWDDATNFTDRIAAVLKDGKWALINTRGELLTDYIYLDVKRDNLNNCTCNGLLWVKDGNGYQLLNKKLEAVSTEYFDDVKCFRSKEPCAVKQGIRWGFCDTEGKLVIPCSYEDADSFTIGYAPVNKNGLWGYVGEDGKLLIDYTFDEVRCFNEAGTAPTRRDAVWTLIKLGIYK